MARMLNLALLALCGLAVLAEAKTGVRIIPEPNGQVGMMRSESKYFQCIGSRFDNLVWLDPRGKEITNDPNNRIYSIMKKNTLKLELKSPIKADSGVYKCVARNERNKETSSAFFHLHVYNPTEVKGSASYKQNEGERMSMECLASSDKDTTVEFTWKFGNNDLSRDPARYRITTRQESQNYEEVKTVSKLDIANVTKEHDGNYVCEVDSTNQFVSNSQELRITLRVQYKPRFDEKTPKYIWVSEEAVRAGGPLSVNISCIVYADPVSTINWISNRQLIQPNQNLGNVRTQITDTENMSILTLTYRNSNEIKYPRPNSRIRYMCEAKNTHGTASNTFEIKVGNVPQSPQIVSIDYKDGSIVLTLNETSVEPPVDSYRLEIGNDEQAHLFNKSNAKENANNTYVIEMGLPRGEHRVSIYSHNPVGWSLKPYNTYFLTVVSGANPLTSNWFSLLILVTLCHLCLGGSLSQVNYSALSQ